MDQLLIDETDKLLIIAPHPDDECIGVGGILSLYPKQCDVWVLSDGRHGITGQNAIQTKEIRYNEFLDEMKEVLPNSYRLFGVEDSTLMQNMQLLDEEDLSYYSKIFVTSDKDSNLDHVAAAKIVMNALKKCKYSKPEIFFYEVASALENQTHFINITSVIDKKIKAINFHSSQLKEKNYCELAKSLNSFRACSIGLYDSFIEVFAKLEDNYNGSQIGIAEKAQKFKCDYLLLANWLDVLIEDDIVRNKLVKSGIKTMAIYGYGQTGILLHKYFKKIGINVVYAIDRKVSQLKYQDIIIKRPNDFLEAVDLLIISTIFYKKEIYEQLRGVYKGNVISFDELLSKEHSLNSLK